MINRVANDYCNVFPESLKSVQECHHRTYVTHIMLDCRELSQNNLHANLIFKTLSRLLSQEGTSHKQDGTTGAQGTSPASFSPQSLSEAWKVEQIFLIIYCFVIAQYIKQNKFHWSMERRDDGRRHNYPPSARCPLKCSDPNTDAHSAASKKQMKTTERRRFRCLFIRLLLKRNANFTLNRVWRSLSTG